MLLYSYAIHLRKGSYRNLPHSRPNNVSEFDDADLNVVEDDDEEVEDFYRVPIRAPQSQSSTNLPIKNDRDSRRASNHSLPAQTIPLSRSNSARTLEAEGHVLFDENGVAGGRSKYGVQEGNTDGDERSGLVGSNRMV